MEKIKTIDTKRTSYFCVFAVNARFSLGLLFEFFEFGKNYTFYIKMGLGVVELSYSIQKIAHKPRNGQVV